MTSRFGIARCSVAALALVVSLVLSFPTTASATSRKSIEYDALGDSYAAGYGVPPYAGGECSRSQAAYAMQLDRLRRIDLDDFVACTGATTSSLVTGGQLQALDEHTDLVTISIGGNAIGWQDAVGACLGPNDAACAGELADVRDTTTTVLPGLLNWLYPQVSASAPNAHVVVTGYARLFSPEYGPFLGASASEQRALNRAADTLNRVIARAAAKHRFEFVDVTKRFVGHGVNAPDAWILGPSAGEPAFHPNIAGYRAYTAAVAWAITSSRFWWAR